MTPYTVDQPYFYCTWTSSALASSPTSTDPSPILDLALQRLPQRLLLLTRALLLLHPDLALRHLPRLLLHLIRAPSRSCAYLC